MEKKRLYNQIVWEKAVKSFHLQEAGRRHLGAGHDVAADTLTHVERVVRVTVHNHLLRLVGRGTCERTGRSRLEQSREVHRHLGVRPATGRLRGTRDGHRAVSRVRRVGERRKVHVRVTSRHAGGVDVREHLVVEGRVGLDVGVVAVDGDLHLRGKHSVFLRQRVPRAACVVVVGTERVT